MMASFLTLFLVTIPCVLASACPEGWTDEIEVGLGCIKGRLEAMNWGDAAEACWLDQGAHLVEIKTEVQHTIVTTMAKVLDPDMESWWMGATDLNREGEWYWANTLEPLSYTKWDQATGQPDNADYYNYENCGSIRKKYDYNWNDWNCNNQYYFICQVFL